MTSTINESRRQTELDIARDGVATRVFLQPIAAPSTLGLFGFAGASLTLSAVLGTLAAGSGIAAGGAAAGGMVVLPLGK